MDVGSFLCNAPAEAGSLTVPAWVLSAIPSITEGVPIAFLGVSFVSYSSFTAPGVDLGIFTGATSQERSVSFR